MADESLPLEFRQDGEGLFDGAFGRRCNSTHAQVDDVERIDGQRLRRLSWTPSIRPLARTSMIHEPSSPRRAPTLVTMTRPSLIGMQRFFDDLVGDVRAVEVAGVDVVDACGDGLTQHGEGGGAVLGWSKDVGPGELHGSVAHAVDSEGGAGESEGAAEIGFELFMSCLDEAGFRSGVRICQRA